MDDFDDFDDYANSGDSEDEDLAEAYCEAKEKKPSGSEDAVDAFEFVLALEQRDAQLTEWGFKALKQLLKLGAAKGSADAMRTYKRILAYHSAVTDSQMEKACLKVLAFLSDVESFREFGQITNEGLRDAKPMLWSRMAMRLATTFIAGGHDDDALLVLADVQNAVQGNARLAAVEDSLLLDVYKFEAEIRIRKRDFTRIANIYAEAESRQLAENPAAMAVINECYAVRLMLTGQYARAEKVLITAAKVHSDERSGQALRCSQLLAMNAALQAGADNDKNVLAQPTDIRVNTASELARRYQTEHGDAFLTEAQKFLAGDTDPLVACLLEQWASSVRKAQAEMDYCLDYPADGRMARNVVFQADRFARLRKLFTLEPDAYIWKLCVTRAWAAELQYWLRLGEDLRVMHVVDKALDDQEACDVDLKDSSAALLKEFCGRSLFETCSLSYAQRDLRAALPNCSTERVNGCTQLLALVCLLLGEKDDAAQQNLEETDLDLLRQLAKHICTFEPADCARLLSKADCVARVDPYIVKTLHEWIAFMEPVEECVREVEAQQALEQSDYTTTMQRVEELKKKAMAESNETVGLMCRLQLCAAELQIAHATGDFRRLRLVLAEIRSSVLKSLNVTSVAEKVVDDRTSATGIIQEFEGRMQLMDGKVSEALSTFLSAAQTYSYCGSKRLTACKQLVLFCRLMQHAAGGHDLPATEAADEALLELLIPLNAAIAKADLDSMRSIVDGPSFAKLTNDGLHDAVSHWLNVLEDTNRFLTKEGQEFIDRSDYLALDRTLEDVTIPAEIFDKLTRDTWMVRLWSLEVQMGYHCQDNKLVDRLVERMERLSVSVQHSEPAGIVLEFSGKRYLHANDRQRALERFQQALQIFEINESNRRFASARYIALTLRPNQPLSDHLHEQYASTAGVVGICDLMEAYYGDERHRFYELMGTAQELLLDAFVAERLELHCRTLKARICSRPIQLPAETWEVVLSMLRDEHKSVQSTCSKFRETFANAFNMPHN
ncbi:COP9 signalosome complex subunit 2 [Aphelenchoides avenae]|nr:COP9 signalosome complex subunit 2 [Aphelenchus avenae]